jgi:hypothetical protein
MVHESLGQAQSRAASCLGAARKTLPVAGLLAALAFVCLCRPGRAQTPATAWGYMAGSENANANDDAGTPAVPGGRQGAATWTDQSGNFWLFGGNGYDSSGNLGTLNDLWEYSSGVWALKSAGATITVPGSGLCNKGNYTSGSYVVGGRNRAATWVDAGGNLWLFGGEGCGNASTSPGTLNDLWMYNIASGKWSFEGGDETTGQTGSYGQQNISSSSFLPGARYGTVAWTGADGSFWLFGGDGVDSTGSSSNYLNDLWKLNPTTLEWTWVSGSLTNDQAGSYGTLGQPGPSNVPGSREFAAGTTDSNGNFWLFGGDGCTTSCAFEAYLNDLWMFNPTTLEWTWEGGTQGENQSGYTGTKFVTASSNAPGSRDQSYLWADAAGNLWVFGGYGDDTTDTLSNLNDLWEFDTTTREWTFMGGSATGTGAQTPDYGTEGTPTTANIPGGRSNYSAWNTLDGNFWLFGGDGYNATTLGSLNDLWEAIPPTPTPAFSLPAGTYEGTQTLAMSDAANGAAIYYTTDGSQPTTSSTAYTGPIMVSKSEYVQAIAVAADRSPSLTRQAQYVIEPETAITWETPAPITYGTPLSSVQLDASTSIPGSYDYTPGEGTIPTAGTHTLTVLFTPTNTTTAGFMAATATVNLQVNQATPVITWATPAPIAYGTALSAAQLDASATVAGNFVYSPAAGTILNVGTHTLNVTFTPTDTLDFETVTASVTINVTGDAPTITWARPAAITYGTALSGTQLNATAAYGGAAIPGTFVYSPAAGQVLSAGTQALSVTFTPTDSIDYASATATTTIVVNQATPLVNWPTPAAITYGAALGSAQLDATASVPGTFVYSPAAGTILTAGPHILNVTFTPSDTTDYTTATNAVAITVNQATPVLSWAAPAAIAYGTALGATQLDATASYNGVAVAGVYTYSPAANTVLAAGAHTLTVIFLPTDTTNFTAATSSATINVTEDAPAITWAKPAAIAYGTALSATQLDATAVYGAATVPGTFVYSPAAGQVLTAGTQTLSSTFTPTDAIDYASVTASTTIVVNQATPILNWQAPAAIDYGAALSSAQLDATASVPGTFVYSPAAGTVPAAGAQTLSVTFIPADTTDYATATASVTLTVLAPGFTVSGSPTGQTVYAGYSTDFVITVAPAGGIFNNAVTLAVTGLPQGATATFAQTSLTPGSSAASTILTVAVPASTSTNQRPASPFGGAPRAIAPLMALLLLLPFRKMRRGARTISLLLVLAVSLGAMLSLSACGTPATKTVLWQSEYVLTVTGTSGATAQTAQLVLTVE